MKKPEQMRVQHEARQAYRDGRRLWQCPYAFGSRERWFYVMAWCDERFEQRLHGRWRRQVLGDYSAWPPSFPLREVDQ